MGGGIILKGVHHEHECAGVSSPAAAAGASVQVATGGMSSYDTSQSTGLPSWLTLGESVPDTSGGIFAFVAAGTPSGSVANFNLNATDGLGNNIVQQVQVTVS